MTAIEGRLRLTVTWHTAEGFTSAMTGSHRCRWARTLAGRGSSGSGARLVLAALIAAVLAAAAGCAAQQSPPAESGSSGSQPPEVSEPAGTIRGEGAEAAGGPDAGSADAAVFAFSCGDSVVADERLPQGHQGLALDAEGLGMVEHFAFSYSPDSGRVDAEAVSLVPESLLGDWSTWPESEHHVLEFLDSSGETVHTEPLRPRLTTSGALRGWTARVRQRPAYESFRTRRGDHTVAEFASTPSAPVLHSLATDLPDTHFPVNWGVVEPVVFSWVACEPDADALIQRTYYSTDDGHSYRLIQQSTTEPRPEDPHATTTTILNDNGFTDYSAPDTADTSAPKEFTHTAIPRHLERSPRAHFIAVVSDGVRWNAARSPQFELAHPTIRPAIWSPENGVTDYSVPDTADTSAPKEFTHTAIPRHLERSPRAHFIAVVSDGVRWNAARSPQFELVHPIIWPVIWSPDDAAVYRSDEEIVLEAGAEGALSGEWRVLPIHMYHWHSDIDGNITTEAPRSSDAPDIVGRIPPGSLTPGTHILTLTATDETANTGSETVTIEIRDPPNDSQPAT